MPNTGWKDLERRLAKERLEGKRVGVLGGEDVSSKCFSIEAKLYKTVPKLCRHGIKQAVNNCPEGKIPVAIIKQKHIKDVLVIMLYKDWDLMAKIYEKKAGE